MEPEIKFIEHLKPALTAGVYNVGVKIEFGKTGDNPGLLPDAIGARSEWIFVSGERFHLKPSDIDSIYPPDNGQGFFEDTLPHIVFRRSGLPWEREIFPHGGSGQSPSWLALLLFDEEDPAPTPRELPISALTADKIPPGVWFPPEFHPEQDEDPQKMCTVIDIAKVLFDKIKPSPNELKYLAHARNVNVEFKPGYIRESDPEDPEAEAPTEQEYAVVIGNRLPRSGKESIVHLVSLEGFQPLLEDQVSPKTETGEKDSPPHTVRLVSLKSWRFFCEDSGGSFKDHVTGLNGTLHPGYTPTTDHPIFLHFPFQKKQNEQKKIFEYLLQGFLPMEHKFRQGLKSVSWYRGPLCPLPVNTMLPLKAPFASADALLIYDPDTGFYNVSYAAAWQLGQLLALRNKSFARAQFFWKQQTSIDARKSLERKVLAQKLPVQPMNENGNMPLPDFGAINGNPDALENATAENIQGTDSLNNHNEELVYSANTAYDWYKIVEKYLMGLKALRDVPYNYLIPDPQMLPAESLRFFFVDPTWIQALIDGAFSLGDLTRQKEDENEDEDAKRKKFLLESGNLNPKPPAYSGFLLRSSIMKIWPGMELRVFGEKNTTTPLSFVRHERIAEDVLLGIVEGHVSRLELREPPEGLHFGVSVVSSSEGKISFKKQGKTFHTKNNGVLDIEALAKELKSGNPARFGLNMVEPISTVEINLNPSK